MGTRADFYIGRGENAEWIGSTAWDGYPEGIQLTTNKKLKYGYEHLPFPEGSHLFDSSTEQEFRERVSRYFANREDFTLPADGWPWPWDDSGTTDYAYAFDGGKVWASCFGRDWFDPKQSPPEEASKSAVFPDMSKRKNVRFDRGSGVLIFGGLR